MKTLKLQEFFSSFLEELKNHPISIKIVALLFLFTILASFAKAQNIVVQANTIDGKNIPGAEVTSNGEVIGTTDLDGTFVMQNLIPGETYIIHLEKPDYPADGTNIVDVDQIFRHVLKLDTITEPYELIAANINFYLSFNTNRNNIITAIDMLELKKMIIGIYNEFPQNYSWNFVRHDYMPINPLEPWQFEDHQSYTFTYNGSPLTLDFIGIKTGDVNRDVVPRSGNTIYISLEQTEAGILVTLDRAVDAIQFKLLKEGNIETSSPTNGGTIYNIIQNELRVLQHELEEGPMITQVLLQDLVLDNLDFIIEDAWSLALRDKKHYHVALAQTSLNNKLELAKISLYPNPTVDYINMKGEDMYGEKYCILNILGQEVLSGMIDGSSIDLQSLVGGTYIFTVYNKKREVRQKFVKAN